MCNLFFCAFYLSFVFFVAALVANKGNNNNKWIMLFCCRQSVAHVRGHVMLLIWMLTVNLCYCTLMQCGATLSLSLSPF